MVFQETKLSGAYLIDQARMDDERGFFARSWCQREFSEHELNPRLVQCNVSYNKHRGTLRGMHYQLPPYAEAKLVRCTRGAIYDVVIDLRPTSATFLDWVGAELNEENGRMLYVPIGFAHGFITLTEASEVFYQMSEFYSPLHARSVRWNDPLFRIEWPEVVTTISAKDREIPDATPDDFQQFAGMGI